MISQDRMEKALKYLAETDAEVAQAEGDVLSAEYKVDLVKDRIFLTSEGTVAERQARAGVSNETLTAHTEYVSALVALKRLKAKRATEAMILETWRTQEASRRHGL